MVAACAFSLHARLQFIIERLRILLICTVDNDGCAARIHGNAGIATGVGVASIAAVKGVFEGTHGEAQVAKAVHTRTVDVLAGVVIVVDDVVDVRIRNGEVFPLAGFDADRIRIEANVHTTAKQRPSNEGANCDGEDRDGGSAFARDRARRNVAIGQLATIIAVRINHRQKRKHEHINGEDAKRHVALRMQCAGHAEDPAHDPKPAAETMGGVPIFLIFQRPLDLDADGIILPHFWHNVAEHEDHQSK